ncbi:MAG: cobalamin-dependent protein [Proteobacteria bacterium]|nr:cobalamin-dependent protein [Pseudomonadota bacterium]MBU1449571.1 cobalamin-dependent protein [Pseudomonadota bacterium]MBU2468442.1 cobalamin-dependent protein [Pseudomonadota bacterium]MBU2516868.1 cobalamin-dependent protein [Pseudomonadota bacterium]
MNEELVAKISDLQEEDALRLAGNIIKQGGDPNDVLAAARKAMEEVGQRFAVGDYFIPDLIYSGTILKGIVSIIKPHLKQEEAPKKKGAVIIGTVAGDVHDIGKDIVVFMLDCNGFEVFDLGIDVPKQVFIDKIIETNAKVVGLSGFLTLAFEAMKETVDAIKEAGLRDEIKIMIGGGQIDEKIMNYTGADAYGNDALDAVNLARDWLMQ